MILVEKQILVHARPATCFRVFTEQMGAWWPLATHHIGAVEAADAVMEPRAGGRWFERGVDGSECNWGVVRVWDPPARLVLAWQISAAWRFDAGLDTEVDVRFEEVEGGTRVTLVHRGLEAYGEAAELMRATFDGDGGWPALLAAFAAVAR